MIIDKKILKRIVDNYFKLRNSGEEGWKKANIWVRARFPKDEPEIAREIRIQMGLKTKTKKET